MKAVLRHMPERLAPVRRTQTLQRRFLSQTGPLRRTPDSQTDLNIEELLSTPNWSVKSLLPSESQATENSKITSEQLHHLLKLSALPPHRNADEEKQMRSTLASQLHFVEEIQKVDTTGIEPLRSLHDETAEGQKEAEIGLDELKEALSLETIQGSFHKRIRRQRSNTKEEEDVNEPWDPLKHASKTVGRYFVVQGGKER